MTACTSRSVATTAESQGEEKGEAEEGERSRSGMHSSESVDDRITLIGVAAGPRKTPPRLPQDSGTGLIAAGLAGTGLIASPSKPPTRPPREAALRVGVEGGENSEADGYLARKRRRCSVYGNNR